MRHIALLFALVGALIMMVFGTHTDTRQNSSIEPDMEYIRVAQSGGMELEEVLRSSQWQSLGGESPNFGYIRDTVWLRLTVPTIPQRRLLEIRYPQLDKITYYLLRNGEVIDQVASGDHLPFDHRPIQHRNFLFPFQTGDSGNHQIVLKVQTQGAMQVPVRIWEPTEFFETSMVEDQLHALYYGILITVIFFNLFIYLALRETMYLLYVLSTLGYLLLLANLNGTLYQLVWPDTPWLHNQAMLMTVPVAVLFTLMFARSFLSLDKSSPIMDRLVRYTIVLNLAMVATTFVFDYSTASRLTVAVAIPSCLLLTIIGPLQWIRGNPQASYYTIAWGLVTVGSAITASSKYGFIPNNFFTAYSMQVGSALEAILLTIALAARLYQEREDKVIARESEIRAMDARRKVELQMMDQALHNPLTGLPNRTSFEMMVNDLISRRPDRRHAVAVIHLNNLQAITKTLGHGNTDRLLELAARRFNSIVRDLPGVCPVEEGPYKSFHLASLEAATFGFVADADVTGQVPRSILQGLEQLREPIDYLGMQLPLEPQIGVAVFPEHAQDTNSLIRRAYIAQESDFARDRGLAYYQPSRDSYSADRLTLVSDFRHALNSQQLALYLQPKMSLKNRDIVGLEALIRWPGRNPPMAADQLIDIAEQTGLIKPLTRWVLEQALAIRTRLVERGFHLGVSVNISPNNLREPEFPLFVQRLMNTHPAHRGKITLEVTETSMMLDPANSLRALKSLEATGIPLSIDDFGSGYSSLSYIKQLPAQEIKIDRSLITDLANQVEDRVIVQTTIDMCHSLGYLVVAEGVEDEDTLTLLEAMDCDMVQGYTLTQPLPFNEMVDWLEARAGKATLMLG